MTIGMSHHTQLHFAILKTRSGLQLTKGFPLQEGE
jgi:hypothetical protein